MAQTTPPSMTPTPTPLPQRNERSTFSARVDAFVTWLATGVSEFGALAANVYANAVDAYNNTVAAAASAAAALISQTAASASASAAAASVAGSANATGTSASSTAVGTGAKTITTQTGKNFPIGAFIQMARTSAAATTYMNGAITAYDSGTGVLTFESTISKGSGTYTDWTISISAPYRAVGIGGASPTSNVVLTVESPAAQSMTPPGYGYSYKLPDATTCSKGTGIFSLGNASAYAVKVLNSAGLIVGFVPPFGTVETALSDASTASGVWSLKGAIPVAVTAEITSLSVTLGSSMSDLQMCALDSTRTLITTGQSSGGGVYGVIYDSATNAFGALTLIRAGAYVNRLVQVDTGKALCVSFDATTGMQSNVITATGTSIAVGANGTATLSASFVVGDSTDLVSVSAGASYAVGYGVGTARQVRAISVSGTVSTIGAAVVLSGGQSYGSIYAASSTAILAISFTASTNVHFSGVGIAGSVATLGTVVTAATDSTIGFRSFVWGARWGILYANSGAIRCALVSMTAGVPSVTTAAGTGPVTNGFVSYLAVQISGTKCVTVHDDNTASVYSNLFTDTAGTVSAGTAVTTVFGSTHISFAPLGVASNIAYFALSSSSAKTIIGLNISAASPTIASVKSNKTTTGGIPSPTTFGDADVRQVNTLSSSHGLYVIGQQVDALVGLVNKAGTQVIPGSIPGLCSNVGAPGLAANESWVSGHPVAASTSVIIQRVECVA